MSGVIVHFYFGLASNFKVLLLIGSVVLVQLIPKISVRKIANPLFIASAISWFFYLGLFLSSINDSRNSSEYFGNYLEQSNKVVVRLIEPSVEKEKSVKCVVEVLQIDDAVVSGKSLIYFEKDTASRNLHYGDIICFKGNFNEIFANGNPHEFDYRRYLAIHDIHHQAYVQSGNWMKQGEKANFLFQQIFNIRDYLSAQLARSGLDEKNLMVANALLLGQKEYLDKEVLRSYSSAGAMHVLAVSGLHVGIVMLLLGFILGPIKKWRRGKVMFLSLMLCGIWFYAIITGLSPSVLRAAVMFSFIVLGKELQRDTSIYQSILVSAFMLIVIEPYIIFQVGFQLSYLAVIGIVYIQPKIANLIYVKNVVLDKAWQITSVSIAAQLATFPLGLYYFHQFPNFFMISNLIVIPLAFALLIIGLSFFILHWIPIISDVLIFVFDSLLSLLNSGVSWIQNLPYSIVWGISIHWYEVFLLYLIIVMGIVALVKKSYKLLMGGMILSASMLFLNILEVYQINAENKLFVYNVNNEVAVDVFTGSHNTFFATSKMFEDEEKMLFHVKHNWFYRSGKEDPSSFVDVDSIKPYIQFGNDFMYILNEKSIQNTHYRMPNASVVMIESIDFIDQSIIDSLRESSSKIIIGPKVGYGLKRYLKKEISNSLIHDLNKDGVFEISF